MRRTLRTTLAATAVVGLLAVPVAGAGAASTTTSLTLSSNGGTLSVSVPDGTATSPVDLGSVAVSNGGTLTSNGLGDVTVSDTRTGLVRTVTVTTSSGVSTTAGPVSFCQDSDGDATNGITCSDTVGESLTLAQAVYGFNTLSTTGDATVVETPVDGVLGTATASLAATAGSFTTTWNPTFDITLLGTEVAGTYYGAVDHSVS